MVDAVSVGGQVAGEGSRLVWDAGCFPCSLWIPRAEAEASLQSALFVLLGGLFLPVKAFPLLCEECLDCLLYVSFSPALFF